MIFKNGECESWISSDIKYLKAEYPEILYIKPKISGLCKTVPEISKNKFLLFWMAAILNIANIVEATKSQVASIKILP